MNWRKAPLLLLPVLCITSLEAAERTKAVNKPNIIVIVADDLGYADICAYGCKEGRTPNIDSLAEAGIKFTDGYVTAPICSPSRAALLTGRYQHRFGHEFNAGGALRSHRLGLGTPTSEVMLPARLKKAGYVTGMVGKWHLGSTDKLQPQSRGFDEFFGFLHGANQYFEPTQRADAQYVRENMSEQGDRPDINPILRGRVPVKEPEYLTDAFTREAVDFIRRHHREPFFLYLPYNAPHTPLQVTNKYYDRFPEIENHALRIYTAMISAVDDGVGEVLAALKEHEILENTVVLFTSDNGCASYFGVCTNAPLAGGKLLPLEGGVRVPFLMQWVGHFEPGQVIKTPVSTLDIVPTALELAGVELPRLAAIRFDGRSMLPVIAAADDGSRPALFWRNGPNWGVRENNWKLVVLNGHEMLFDLASDIGESRNLIEEQPQKTKRLKSLFDNWAKATREPLWPPKTIIKYPLELPGIGNRIIDVAI